MKLGIKEKTATTIHKYILKGGKFYKAEDIKKIWGLSQADAERLIPYVSIKEIKKERKFHSNGICVLFILFLLNEVWF